MRKAQAIGALAFAISLLAGLGCGSTGGSDGDGGKVVDSRLLTGSDTSTGGSLTSKRWHSVSLKANANYNGTGADQPCPVELTLKSGSGTTSCRPDDYTEFRSDGTARAQANGIGGDGAFDDTWSFSGDVLTHTINDAEGQAQYSYRITDGGTVGGKQRLRIRVLSGSVDGDPQPEDIGLEFVVEEMP